MWGLHSHSLSERKGLSTYSPTLKGLHKFQTRLGMQHDATMWLSGFISRSPNDHPESTWKRTLHTSCFFIEKFVRCGVFFSPIIAALHFLQRHWGCTRHLLCPLSGKTDTHPKGGVERSVEVGAWWFFPEYVVRCGEMACGSRWTIFHTIFFRILFNFRKCTKKTTSFHNRGFITTFPHVIFVVSRAADFNTFVKRSKITSQTRLDEFQVFGENCNALRHPYFQHCLSYRNIILESNRFWRNWVIHGMSQNSRGCLKTRDPHQVFEGINRFHAGPGKGQDGVKFRKLGMGHPKIDSIRQPFFSCFERVDWKLFISSKTLLSILTEGKVVSVLEGLLPFKRLVLSSVAEGPLTPNFWFDEIIVALKWS